MLFLATAFATLATLFFGAGFQLLSLPQDDAAVLSSCGVHGEGW